MITEQDLQEAIAECEGERDPNSGTCIKLAAFYIIRRELFGDPEKVTKQAGLSLIGDRGLVNPNGYSYAPPPDTVETTIDYQSDTEFGHKVYGRTAADIWPLVDELVSDAIKNINPRLYNAFMRRLT